jgi:hypothetical protein
MDNTTNTVYLAGATSFSEKFRLPVHKASVSPDGKRIEVSAFAEGGCGGTFEASTVVIDAGTLNQTALRSFFADAWLDNDHLVGHTAIPNPLCCSAAHPMPGNWSTHLQIANVKGGVTDVVRGQLIGVLRG